MDEWAKLYRYMYMFLKQLMLTFLQVNDIENCVSYLWYIYIKLSVQFDYYRFRDTSHADFVTGLSWHGNDNLFSCGWDSKVKNHCVSKSEQTSEDCVVVQMETDSIDKENVKKKIAKISLVCNGNGAELESTWWLYLPPYIDTMALCSNKLIIHYLVANEGFHRPSVLLNIQQ